MSPTTSVKFVNLTLTASNTARVISFVLLFSMTWAVTLSDTPIVLSIYLLLMIAKLHFGQLLVASASQGIWSFHCNGTVRTESKQTQIKRIDLSTLPFKIAITLQSGDSVTVWRDSCADTQYRQLSLVLRQWEMKQGADAPC
ncbi:protein YgfX [Vibrio sp. YYF0003]|uniref:protein YgfX n=1 Tax=Vibrio sp. YYF0003 TaxID=3116646 RepID=UPI002EC3EE69|nr:protein YgfX [Vibrio sp. YYF0003]